MANDVSIYLEFLNSESDGDEGRGQESTVLSETREEGGGVWAGLGVGTHTLHVVRHQRLGQLATVEEEEEEEDENEEEWEHSGKGNLGGISES